jgi:hypothetical protein
MTASEAAAAGYRIIRASACEWGLVKGTVGIRTWWHSEMFDRPTLKHPRVRAAIRATERMYDNQRS